MKHIFVLLAITAAFVASASAQSDPRYAKTSALSSPDKANVHVTRVKQPAGRQPIAYYITNESVTGSHLPVVVCHYEGRNYVMFSASRFHRIYGQSDIGLTGSLSVGGALRELDPAVKVF